MGKQILVNSDMCTGCRLCQLSCSLAKRLEFNPAKAHVKLFRIDGQERYGLAFTDECDGCGVCAKYCFYGVLQGVKVSVD